MKNLFLGLFLMFALQGHAQDSLSYLAASHEKIAWLTSELKRELMLTEAQEERVRAALEQRAVKLSQVKHEQLEAQLEGINQATIASLRKHLSDEQYQGLLARREAKKAQHQGYKEDSPPYVPTREDYELDF